MTGPVALAQADSKLKMNRRLSS